MKFLMTLFLVLGLTSICTGDERSEVVRLCSKYEAIGEVRLWDGTRVDMLSKTHAYEVDWVRKYPEGIGQAIYYAAITGKTPAVVLLVKDKSKEARYMYRATIAAQAAGVELHFEQVKPISQQLVSLDEPVRAYMIFDTTKDKWFTKGVFAIGVVTWGPQNEGAIWTSKAAADKQLSQLLGDRVKECTIKSFVLIPTPE